jgi:hypothetical protein
MEGSGWKPGKTGFVIMDINDRSLILEIMMRMREGPYDTQVVNPSGIQILSFDRA